MITTTGTSGRDATLSANLGEHQRHVPSAVAMQMAPIVVPRMNSHQQKCSDTTIEKYIRKSSRFPSTADDEAPSRLVLLEADEDDEPLVADHRPRPRRHRGEPPTTASCRNGVYSLAVTIFQLAADPVLRRTIETLVARAFYRGVHDNASAPLFHISSHFRDHSPRMNGRHAGT